MKVLVTGGAGFIGSHLAEALLKRGCRVLVVDNLYFGERRHVPPGAELHRLSIVSKQFASLVKRERPEVVFHLAAQTSVTFSVRDPIFDARVNVLGSLNLIRACIEAGVRKVVYTSSGGAIYGEPSSLPVAEGHPIRPASSYGLSKYTVERYLDIYRAVSGLGYTVLRLPNVYGPRQKPTGEAGVVAIFAYQMFKGQQPVIFGDGTKTRDYVYVTDIVQAALTAMEQGDGGVYNLGTGRETTDQEVYDAVAGAARYQGAPHYGQVRPGEIYRMSLDASLARRELEWGPAVPFEEGVDRTVDYIRHNVQTY